MAGAAGALGCRQEVALVYLFAPPPSVSSQDLLACNSFAYTGSGGGDWARTCYLRLDFDFISTAVPPALTVTSGRRSTRFSRSFAHAFVDVDLVAGDAQILWS